LKARACQAALPKTPAGPAGTWIIAAKLLDQFLIAMHDTVAALNVSLAVESPSDVYSSAQNLKS
jgi:hypothetical protein